MDLLVCKFGGSSVATSENLQRIVQILQENQNRRCVVLSAPGKAPGFTTKVTDLLITATIQALNNEEIAPILLEIKNRFRSIYKPLGLSDATIDTVLGNLDERAAAPKSDTGKFRDLMVAAGEDLNCQLFAHYCNSIGTKAQYLNPKDAGLLVTSVFSDAQPLPDTMEKLSSVIKERCATMVTIFPGFFGYTVEGDVATFSRGGSDLTGSILAEALDAAEYENWTDVDGIFSAHPAMVNNPEQISALTYKEMRELSYIGFNVLHEEAVKPVMRKKIPIRLRNTRNLANQGTLIIAERLPSERDVIGIATGGNYCSFTLQKFLMNREKGFGRQLLGIFEELDLSYEHCPSGVDNISVTLDQSQLKTETINTIIRMINKRLQPDEIKTEFGIALVSVVGEGLVHKIGVLAQAAGALSRAEVNVKMVNQGSSEISIIFGIDAADEHRAVNALYNEFFRK